MEFQKTELTWKCKKEILKTQKNETYQTLIIFYKKISYVVFLQNIRKKFQNWLRNFV